MEPFKGTFPHHFLKTVGIELSRPSDGFLSALAVFCMDILRGQDLKVIRMVSHSIPKKNKKWGAGQQGKYEGSFRQKCLKPKESNRY